MTTRLFKIGTLAVVATSLVGCSPQSSSPNNKGTINAAAIIASPASPADKAQRLADASEQLLSVQGFDYASDVADLALAQDSTNVKAQFVKAILGPILTQRGIAARVAPLADLDPKAADGYQQLLAKIDEQPDSTVKTFILDGHGDIKSESDIQAQLDSVADAFGKIRQFAKANKGAIITMNGTDEMYQALMDRYTNLCTVVSNDPYNYHYECPSQVKAFQTTIDRGDFEVIQQYAAGMELYLSLYNSYDLTGAIKFAQDNAAKVGQVLNPKEVIDQLLANPKFATLRGGNGLAKVKALGADAITGVRWVMANQAKLCPMAVSDPHNRVGALVNEGLCVNASQSAKVNLATRRVEAVLNGAIVTVGMRVQGGYTTTQLKPSALLDAPIADLRSLGPITYSPCGKVAGLGDASIGGLFPQKDANLFLANDAQKCH